MGIMNLKEICEFGVSKESSVPLEGLVFASEDYCADVCAIRTEHRRELLYARSAVVTAAAAYGLQSIDIVRAHFAQRHIGCLLART